MKLPVEWSIATITIDSEHLSDRATKKILLNKENSTCSGRNGHRFRKRQAKMLKMVPIEFMFFCEKVDYSKKI